MPAMQGSFEELLTLIRALPEPPVGPRIVAISGFGGAGKTTLTKRLAEALNADSNSSATAEIVRMDAFFVEEWDVRGDDWPCYDRDRLIEQVLRPARAGETITYQGFDWQHAVSGRWETVSPCQFLLVEGVSALHPPLLPYYDLTVWVDCPLEEATERGVRRDRDEFGIADAAYHWNERWMPNEQDYFAKYRPDISAMLRITL
jgi:uridine kinase